VFTFSCQRRTTYTRINSRLCIESVRQVNNRLGKQKSDYTLTPRKRSRKVVERNVETVRKRRAHHVRSTENKDSDTIQMISAQQLQYAQYIDQHTKERREKDMIRGTV